MNEPLLVQLQAASVWEEVFFWPSIPAESLHRFAQACAMRVHAQETPGGSGTLEAQRNRVAQGTLFETDVGKLRAEAMATKQNWIDGKCTEEVLQGVRSRLTRSLGRWGELGLDWFATVRAGVSHQSILKRVQQSAALVSMLSARNIPILRDLASVVSIAILSPDPSDAAVLACASSLHYAVYSEAFSISQGSSLASLGHSSQTYEEGDRTTTVLTYDPSIKSPLLLREYQWQRETLIQLVASALKVRKQLLSLLQHHRVRIEKRLQRTATALEEVLFEGEM